MRLLITLLTLSIIGQQAFAQSTAGVGSMGTVTGSEAAQLLQSLSGSSATQSTTGGTTTGGLPGLPGEMGTGGGLNQNTQVENLKSMIKSLESQEGASQSESQESQKGETEETQSVSSTASSLTLSPVEQGFFSRTANLGIKLKQFGYDFFRGRPKIATAVPVDSSYVLGPGDQLILYIIGAPPNSGIPPVLTLNVDKEGKVYVPGVGVFYVWGMTLGEAQRLIARSLGLNIKLTVGKLRTFPVYVSGEVNRPGAVVVTGINTVVDALMLAGGIKKDGTLRNVIVTRKTPKGIKRIHIDFYKLLLKGEPVDIRLKDGDVIFVGPIGKVAGVGGRVKRPAIYELKGGETLKDLIQMAGGVLPSSYRYKVTIQRYENHQFLKLIQGNLSNPAFMNQKVKDGDLVLIKQVLSVPQNAVLVTGYTPYPGMYQFKPGLKLSQLLKPDFFFSDSNMKFAYIKRIYPPGSEPRYIAFAPEDVLAGTFDLTLEPQDTIVLFRFGQDQEIDFNKIRDAFVVKGEINYPGVYAYKKGEHISDILKPSLLTLNTNLDYAEIDRRDPKTLDIVKIIGFSPAKVLAGKEDIEIKPLDVIRFFPKFIYPPIKVSGLVKHSYYIPYHKGIKLSEALSKAQFEGDVKNLKVEIFRSEQSSEKSQTSLEKAENIQVKATQGEELIKENKGTVYLYDLLIKHNKDVDITLKPGDRLVIQKVAPDEIVEKVSVMGYVNRPGVFKINDKTTLYDVLKAAGGFRPDAFPQGIIILRESVRKMQEERLQKAIALMKQQLEKEEAGVMQSDLTAEELRARQAAFEAKRKLLAELEKVQVTGRISGIKVPFDLEKLKNSPYNILLEDGDRIIVPKRPQSVLIFGEVYNPSAFVYKKGITVRDCIALAGGLTRDADKENIFVIKADGTTVSSNEGSSLISWDGVRKRFIWGGSSSILDYKLQPGDAVIVPTKIHVPIMWRPLIRDVVQIIYQSALTVYTISKL
ncbi:SLBB domain-containing protein [Thermovibrio ammonificans]